MRFWPSSPFHNIRYRQCTSKLIMLCTCHACRALQDIFWSRHTYGRREVWNIDDARFCIGSFRAFVIRDPPPPCHLWHDFPFLRIVELFERSLTQNGQSTIKDLRRERLPYIRNCARGWDSHISTTFYSRKIAIKSLLFVQFSFQVTLTCLRFVRMWEVIPHPKDTDFPWALWYFKGPRSFISMTSKV